ncbi:cytidine deaminase [bacterium]|nr:cytidine deaminase [bacterium]
MTSLDQELVAAARDIIGRRQKPDWHQVGCALRTRSGRVFQAVHLEAFVGRIAVCAEAVALGMGAAEGDTEIEAIVAVNCAGDVVAPCGMCRELISDYAPDARVIVPGELGPELVSIAALLPNKYAR